MRKHIPMGSGVLIKVFNGEIKSSGGIIIASDGARECSAREEAEIIALGEDAFDDLSVKPIVGDKVLIARYEGKVAEDCKADGYEIRVVQDTRILTKIVEE